MNGIEFMPLILKVSIPNTPNDCFDYLSHDDSVVIGSRVQVPFRGKSRVGIVVQKSSSSTIDASRLKSVETSLDSFPLLDSHAIDLAQWLSSYYQYPLSTVFKALLPKRLRQGAPAQLAHATHIRLSACWEDIQIAKSATKQQQCIQLLQHGAMSKQELKQHDISSQTISSLLEKGILLKREVLALPAQNKSREPHKTLFEDQAKAVASILENTNGFRCHLLYGITGSGKTEVYLQSIEPLLKQKRQVLILVPEIGLTPQLVKRFTKRFAHRVITYHSNMNDSERLQAWMLCKQGYADIIIGTRSAIFLPMIRLGMIIVDEEHDASFKQQDGIRYHGRDVAIMRANMLQIPIILGSATPSLESLHNAKTKKFTCLSLNTRCHSTQPTHYKVIDVRNQTLTEGLSQNSLHIIKHHLQAGNQVLVFHNRRGFAPVYLCHHCAHIVDCRYCEAHMTWHKHKNRLVCHHCGYQQSQPKNCPQCKQESFVCVGIGTQRLEAFLKEYFENTNILRIDRDSSQRKGQLAEHLHTIHKGEAQLIIGTQMLAKGHHFPRLTLVVIVDADQGLFNLDYRASEHFGQLITQVSGRAGRESNQGEVVIQTHQPQHPLLLRLLDKGYQDYAEALLTERAQSQFPPFSYLCLLRAQTKDIEQCIALLRQLKQWCQAKNNKVSVLGPAPAPLAFKQAYHHYQLIFKSSHRRLLRELIHEVRQYLPTLKQTHRIQWSLDIDPISLS